MGFQFSQEAEFLMLFDDKPSLRKFQLSLDTTTTDENEEEIEPKLKQIEELRLIDEIKTRIGASMAQSE